MGNLLCKCRLVERRRMDGSTWDALKPDELVNLSSRSIHSFLRRLSSLECLRLVDTIMGGHFGHDLPCQAFAARTSDSGQARQALLCLSVV